MNDVGRCMFGVGALLQFEESSEILLLTRAPAHSNFNRDKWELVFGRKAQFEPILAGLDREIREELGPVKYEVVRTLRMWHFFRGERTAENEIIGVTFWCRTSQRDFTLGDEHTELRWVAPDQALELITVEGIREDVSAFASRGTPGGGALLLSTLDGKLVSL